MVRLGYVFWVSLFFSLSEVTFCKHLVVLFDRVVVTLGKHDGSIVEDAVEGAVKDDDSDGVTWFN